MFSKIISKDFEFNVTFPAGENIKELPEDLSSLTEHFANLNIIKKSNTPVVMILGWLGAEDRHLVKYSSLYDSLGFITIRYVLPVYKLFLVPNWSIPPVVKNLLELVKDLKLTTHPIIFHVLSNNGAWLYYYISEAMKATDCKDLMVKGCIFDSCPSPRSIRSAFVATYRALPDPFILRLMGAVGISYYLIFWKAYIFFHSLCTLDFSFDVRKLSPYGMVYEPFKWPQLFIYSKTDDIVPYQEIENFAAQREKLGVTVHMKIFDSPHVQHQRQHPEEYKKTLEDFLDICLPE